MNHPSLDSKKKLKSRSACFLVSSSMSMGPNLSTWRQVPLLAWYTMGNGPGPWARPPRFLGAHIGGFHQWGTPIAGWFISWKIPARSGWFEGTPISGHITRFEQSTKTEVFRSVFRTGFWWVKQRTSGNMGNMPHCWLQFAAGVLQLIWGWSGSITTQIKLRCFNPDWTCQSPTSEPLNNGLIPSHCNSSLIKLSLWVIIVPRNNQTLFWLVVSVDTLQNVLQIQVSICPHLDIYQLLNISCLFQFKSHESGDEDLKAEEKDVSELSLPADISSFNPLIIANWFLQQKNHVPNHQPDSPPC